MKRSTAFALIGLVGLGLLSIPFLPTRGDRPMDPFEVSRRARKAPPSELAAPEPDRIDAAHLAGLWLLLSGRLGSEPQAADLAARMASISEDLRASADASSPSDALGRDQRALIEELREHPSWISEPMAETLGRIEAVLDQ